MDLPELWTAILSGKYDLANQLINRGANINELREIESYGDGTLLHYAVLKQRDAECIRVLVNLGANLNARDSMGCIPLHWAAHFSNRPDIIEVLINEGAVVDARDNYQFTPLHYAAFNNFIETTQKLIARGASINAIEARGRSVLNLAIRRSNFEMIQMLISHRVDIDPKDIHGRTPLLLYLSKSYNHKTEIIQLLLDHGADVNAKTRRARTNEAIPAGRTALHLACAKGLTDVTALLLKFGADLNACDENGKTPFELLPKIPSTEAFAKIFIREAVKREALGQYLCEGYIRKVESCKNYSKFDLECREEIKRMQSEKIDIEDSNVSFFYILSIDEEKLAALARNETIVTAFESNDYVALFRIYAGELTTKFEVAKKRAHFRMRIEVILNDVLGDMLPAPIVQKIAAYVKYSDIIENDL